MDRRSDTEQAADHFYTCFTSLLWPKLCGVFSANPATCYLHHAPVDWIRAVKEQVLDRILSQRCEWVIFCLTSLIREGAISLRLSKSSSEDEEAPKTCICCITDPTFYMSNSTCFYFIWKVVEKLGAYFVVLFIYFKRGTFFKSCDCSIKYGGEALQNFLCLYTLGKAWYKHVYTFKSDQFREEEHWTFVFCSAVNQGQ